MIPELAKLKELTEDLVEKDIHMGVCNKMCTLIYNTIPHPLLICDEYGIVLFINKSFINRLNYPIDLVLGKNIKTLYTDLNIDLSACCSINKDVYIDSLEGWFELSCDTIYDDFNNPVGSIWTMVDITKRVNNENWNCYDTSI